MLVLLANSIECGVEFSSVSSFENYATFLLITFVCDLLRPPACKSMNSSSNFGLIGTDSFLFPKEQLSMAFI